MKLICLDTCTRALSVAAMQDGALVSAMWHRAQVNHSVLLMPMLSQMLETLGWDAKDVDFWAAVSGPGSFTGVRIGVSSVRALAHGWKKPVVSVNTLEALAMSFPMERALVVPLLDARRDQVYAAAYDMTSGFPKEVMPPCAGIAGRFFEAASRTSGDPFRRRRSDGARRDAFGDPECGRDAGIPSVSDGVRRRAACAKACVGGRDLQVRRTGADLSA